ncbi:MAG: hypothetical protein JW889_05580 [Verrucomicrobia bacterium]|nr:hypothetical protein [Verrucomicrobiota bacterium]
MKPRARFLASLGVAAAVCAATTGGCGKRGKAPEDGDSDVDRSAQTATETETDALARQIELTGRRVLEIEAFSQRRLFWIRFIESLQNAKPDNACLTSILVDGTGRLDALRVENPFRASTPGHRDAVRIVLRGTIKGAFDGDEAALAANVEQLRQTLETRVPFLRNVVTVRFRQQADNAAGTTVLATFEFSARLVRPGVEPLAQAANLGTPDERLMWRSQVDAAYGALVGRLLTWWDSAAHEEVESPHVALGNLQQFWSRIPTYARAENVWMYGPVERPLNLRSDRAAAADILRQSSFMSDVFLLLVHSKVLAIHEIKWHGRATGGEFHDEYSMTVVCSCKYPQLALFLAKLATEPKTKVLPRWWFLKREDTLELPRNFLVVDSLSFVVRDTPSNWGPERHWLREPIDDSTRYNSPPITGRMPLYPTLHVAMTISMIDFGPEIREPLQHENKPPSAAQNKRGEPVDPKALDDRIRALRADMAIQNVPSEFVLRDIASDPDGWLPTAGCGERQCEICGWIYPDDMDHCPYCFAWLENDDDKDGMPNDWEDKYENTDRYEADADRDYDGDNQRNLKEFLGGSNPDDRESRPLSLRVKRIYTTPVDVCFVGYAIGAGGDPEAIDPEFWKVQLSYGREGQADIVPLTSTWHRYALGPLEKVEVPGGLGQQPRTEYALTIQRPGGEPVRLVVGQWVTLKETYADLVISWDGRDSREEFVGMAVGDTLRVDYALREITAISSERVTVDSITVPLLPR